MGAERWLLPSVLFLLSSGPSMVSPQRGCQLGPPGGVKCRAADGTPGSPAGELGTQRRSPSLSPSPEVMSSLSTPEWAGEVSHYKGLSLRRGQVRGHKARLFSRHPAPRRCSPSLPGPSPHTPCTSLGSQHAPPPHCLPLQVLSQLTPQTVMEIDGLLGNKPHSKK